MIKLIYLGVGLVALLLNFKKLLNTNNIIKHAKTGTVKSKTINRIINVVFSIYYIFFWPISLYKTIKKLIYRIPEVKYDNTDAYKGLTLEEIIEMDKDNIANQQKNIDRENKIKNLIK